MTKERISELDRLISGAIDDCQYYDLAGTNVLEFWRGAKMILDELKEDAGIQGTGEEQTLHKTIHWEGL